MLSRLLVRSTLIRSLHTQAGVLAPVQRHGNRLHTVAFWAVPDRPFHRSDDTWEDVKEDVKEKASEAWGKVKRGAEHLKDNLAEAASAEVPPSGETWGSDVGRSAYNMPGSSSSTYSSQSSDVDSPSQANPTSLSNAEFLHDGQNDVLERNRDIRAFNDFSQSNPNPEAVIFAGANALDLDADPARAGVLSTSRGREGSFTASSSSADQAAADSGQSMGLRQDSFKKSWRDGPQEMPEGVGKRARDAEGNPMETGADRT